MTQEVKDIIQRVKALREIEEVSAEDLARELGFDCADYRSWENGDADFPVGALVEIAARFRVDLTELVSGQTPKLRTFCLTRAGAAPEVSRRPMYSYWNLAYNFHRKKAEPFLVEASADTESKPLRLNTHPGQEFDYVLEGRLLISVGGHDLELGPGDAVYYDSQEPHGMKALGGARARFLAFVL
ncbi:MAG: XRE family transcriptional regulator [Spirochaetaceae bacterium]|jgi:transcriptional regulator with XRE-family HTH domain|nr:XRE family transcriptional regulator [Spirochaetaceae bacterium]